MVLLDSCCDVRWGPNLIDWPREVGTSVRLRGATIIIGADSGSTRLAEYKRQAIIYHNEKCVLSDNNSVMVQRRNLVLRGGSGNNRQVS